jgi:uncharacterized protein YbjT (DUF2867 family)
VQKDSWDIDYQATLNALEAARGAGAKHFVLLSAICVQKPLLEFQKAKLKFEAALQVRLPAATLLTRCWLSTGDAAVHQAAGVRCIAMQFKPACPAARGCRLKCFCACFHHRMLATSRTASCDQRHSSSRSPVRCISERDVRQLCNKALNKESVT